MHARHRFEEPWDDDNRRGPGIRPDRLLLETALRGRSRGRGRGHPGAGFGRHGGMGGFGGPMFGRGPKVGRGDVRAAILALLSEKPMHGYQIITELSARTGGMWQASPGSVYPTLQQLEDEGLVTVAEQDGRRTFSLTDAGRAEVARASEGRRAPWEEMTADADPAAGGLRGSAMQLVAAVMQVAAAGNKEQVGRAEKLLGDTRRALYRLLAEDDEPDGRESG
jgi:DNA-binding PadR family transcriptional regulator